MKKLFFITAAFVGMLFLASCGNCDDPTPPPTPSYLEVLKADVNTVLAAYPEFKKPGDGIPLRIFPRGRLRTQWICI